ncbi:MAG: hypothetical protein J6C28_03880 [Bacilli bacterium]|nr:hypothetical protein [Bacilli bacterium]
MNKEDIIKIELLRDAKVQNMHNGFIFPKQYIMKIYYRNNSIRILDLFSKRDITNIDYFKVLEGTKTKVIFEEYKYE